MGLIILFLIILLSGMYVYKCDCDLKSNENVTNVSSLDNIFILKNKSYIRYKSLIFGDKPKFLNSILV